MQIAVREGEIARGERERERVGGQFMIQTAT